MKSQKSEAQLEVYKKMVGETEEMKQKLMKYESENQKLILQQKTLEHELKLADKDKSTVEFIKEELK